MKISNFLSKKKGKKKKTRKGLKRAPRHFLWELIFSLTNFVDSTLRKMKMGFSIPKQATRWPKFCTKVGLIKSYRPTPTMIPCTSPFSREVDFKSRPMLKLGAPNCTKFLGDVEGTKGYNWHYSEFP